MLEGNNGHVVILPFLTLTSMSGVEKIRMDLSLTYVNENKTCVKIKRGYPLLAKSIEKINFRI